MRSLVYIVRDSAGAPLYVGCTQNVARRIAEHKVTGAEWPALADTLEIEGPFDRADALQREAYLIYTLKPRFNKRHLNSPEVNARPRVAPPHASLSIVRQVLGLTLDGACALIRAKTGQRITKPALSAIELGHRGASAETLTNIEHAFGLPAGSLVTDYQPRKQAAA